MIVGAKRIASLKRQVRLTWVVPRETPSRPIVDGRFLFVFKESEVS